MNESTGADQGPMNDPMQTPTLDTTDISDSSTHRGNGRVKSVVWQHIEKVQFEGKDKAQCNYCKKLLVEESKNGTSTCTTI